jgi:hypothetical protein
MKGNDYFTVMESRIKYWEKRYDPNHKLQPDWAKLREEEIPEWKPVQRVPVKKRGTIRKAGEAVASFMALLF